jgi:hypothetical protein
MHAVRYLEGEAGALQGLGDRLVGMPHCLNKKTAFAGCFFIEGVLPRGINSQKQLTSLQSGN